MEVSFDAVFFYTACRVDCKGVRDLGRKTRIIKKFGGRLNTDPHLLCLLGILQLWQLDPSLDDTGGDAPPPSPLHHHRDVLHLPYLPTAYRQCTQFSYSHGSRYMI